MILLTGAAGFIGYHTALALLNQGEAVIGLDTLNDYYDPALKKARLGQLENRDGFTFYKTDIADFDALSGILDRHPDIDQILHLAAQAGVRYSLDNPFAYARSNLSGHLAVLETARALGSRLKHLVYASSSSVYGGNTHQPFAVTDPVNDPVSLYAATKRAGELMTQSYCHLYGFPATGLRFFTVYGPWGRPDMAYYGFTKAIAEGRSIDVYNHGDMKRDFTWIGDIVPGILSALAKPPAPGDRACIAGMPHRLFNLGNNRAERLEDFITEIEKAMGRKAHRIMKEMQPGDVHETCADITESIDILDYRPVTPITEGIPAFVAWYRGYTGAL